MNLNHVSCCGVREMHRLSYHPDPVKALIEFGRCAYTSTDKSVARFRYVVFSEAQPVYPNVAPRNTLYGTIFADYLTSQHLGAVISTGYHINPNSNNHLKLWVWTVNHEAVKAWLMEHAPEVLAPVLPVATMTATVTATPPNPNPIDWMRAMQTAIAQPRRDESARVLSSPEEAPF